MAEDKKKIGFWDGCDVRGLKKIDELTKISRVDFLKTCNNLISQYMDDAEKLGYSKDLASKKILRKLGEEYLFFFCVVILGLDYVNNDYGYRLCFDVQAHKWNRMWIIAREHFKSTIITCASTLWETTKDPNLTYCIYSYKQDTASNFLCQIKNWVEKNDLLRSIWDDVFWSEPAKLYEIKEDGTKINWTWNTNKIEFKRTRNSKEKTIEAGSINGSSTTGGHFHRQIFDDIETQDNVVTPQAIDSLYNSISLAFNTGQTANLDVCFVGTFYAKADAYTRMVKNHVVEEAVIQPCYDTDGNSIFYSAEVLDKKRKKMTVDAWATQMLCDPSMSAQATFNESWLQYWSPEPNKINNLNTYMFVDPSSSKPSKKHDYSCFLVVGINSLENIMVLDLVRDKLTFEKKFSTLCSLYKKWHPVQTFYEEVGMQDDIGSLQREMDRTNLFIPVSSYSPTHMGNKASRIEKVHYTFSNKRIWLPEYSYHTNWLGKNEDMIATFIREEYYGYPNITNDDALDILSTVCIFLSQGKLLIPTEAHDMYSESRRTRNKEDVKIDDYDPMEYARMA